MTQSPTEPTQEQVRQDISSLCADKILMSSTDLEARMIRLFEHYAAAEVTKALDEVEAVAPKDLILVHADLMWCLGKLKGLGYPAEHLEQKWTPVLAQVRAQYKPKQDTPMNGKQ